MWKIPVIIAVIIAVKSILVFFIWNAMVPAVFHLSSLSFPQAVELVILTHLLFGTHGPGHHIRRHWALHWSKLSPEDRDKLREAIAKRCCD